MASLEQPRAKFARATKHLEHLNLVMETVKKSYSDSVFMKVDSDIGKRTWYLGNPEKLPDDFSIVIGEFLYNLRCTLDYLVWQLVLANGKRPDRRNSFYIGRDENDFLQWKPIKLRGISTIAETRIESLKPYDSGNDNLSALNLIENIDKHRYLHAAVCKPAVAFYGGEDTDILHQVDFSQPVKDGAKLLSLPSPEMDVNPHFIFQVFFLEPTSPIKGQAVIRLLIRLWGEVDDILTSFHDLLPDL